MMTNPFEVTTPESMSPGVIAELYVDVIRDIPSIISHGHTFIHGARGTGKSMMLRYLEPSVQKAAKIVSNYSELPFLAIHVPLKTSSFPVEIGRLSESALYYTAEHLLVSTICSKLFQSISALELSDDNRGELLRLFEGVLSPLLAMAGYTPKQVTDQALVCSHIRKCFEDVYAQMISYIRRMSFETGPIPYSGPLLGFVEFMIPLSTEIHKVSFLPSGPLYLMLDDADTIPQYAQQVINSWVSMRTLGDICLKITTQHQYKTFKTITGRDIESPHDFTDISLSSIYSPSTSKFSSRIGSIISRRFKLCSIDSNPESFFPTNAEQDKAIERISLAIKEKWQSGAGRSSRESDDLTRYATAEYMVELASRKARSTFSYSGFHSLCCLSDDIIRWFLEPAARMFNEAQSLVKGKITHIPVAVQDAILQAWSEEFLSEDFSKKIQSILTDTQLCEDEKQCHQRKAVRLYSMINTLGGVFEARLLNQSLAERRVFCFTVAGIIDSELKEILALGVEWGYLNRSTQGTKEGVGRNPRYILSRRLGPYFKLDVSGFAGNMQVTAEDLKLSYIDPKRFHAIKSKSDEQIQKQHSLLGDAQ